MHFLEVAGRVGDVLGAAGASLEGEIGALGAVQVVGMAVVGDGGMAAAWPLLTLEATLWRAGAARLRRLEDGPAASAADVLEECLGTAVARTSMAELLTVVVAALEWA